MIIPLPNVIVRVHRGYPNKSKRPSSHSLCLLYFLIIKRLKVLTFISLFYAHLSYSSVPLLTLCRLLQSNKTFQSITPCY